MGKLISSPGIMGKIQVSYYVTLDFNLFKFSPEWESTCMESEFGVGTSQKLTTESCEISACLFS